MKQSIQQILGDQMPTDLSRPVAITVEMLKHCDLSTLPEGLRLHIQRDNDTIEIALEDQLVRGRLFGEFGFDEHELAAEISTLAELAVRTAWALNVETAPEEEESEECYPPKAAQWFPLDVSIETIIHALEDGLREVFVDARNALNDAAQGLQLRAIPSMELGNPSGLASGAALDMAVGIEDLRSLERSIRSGKNKQKTT